MAVKRWLVTVLLVASSTAQAQQDPAPVPAVRELPAQDLPVQAPYVPAQGLPVQTPYVPAQGLPAQTPYVPAQGLPVQAPYVPPPAAFGPGATGLPPYPGATPSSFVSADEFLDYASWRIKQLTVRERGLTVLGRPENYNLKRAEGFALVGGGASIALGSFSIFFLTSNGPTHSSEDDVNDRVVAGLLVATLVGVGLAIGGAVWLKHLKRDNRYQEEIIVLRQERVRWTQDLKRARRQARIERRMSFDLWRMQVKF